MTINYNQNTENRLCIAAERLVDILRSRGKKIVFAESCTGGKMAAAITTIPGVSEFFCGSAVTYRCETKSNWLSIDLAEIEQHSAESEQTTRSMALGVMRTTQEADFSIAITGHLGPGAPKDVDAIVFVAVTDRNKNPKCNCTRHRLISNSRVARQAEAACIAIEEGCRLISD